MRASIVTLTVAVLALSAVACGPGLNAPKLADGQKIALFVLPDRNISADMDEAKAKGRTQMSEYFEADLKNVLVKHGYDVQLITAADQFTPGPNKFLLDVKVSSYHPGDKGARIAGAFVGGWTGAAMAQRPRSSKNTNTPGASTLASTSVVSLVEGPVYCLPTWMLMLLLSIPRARNESGLFPSKESSSISSNADALSRDGRLAKISKHDHVRASSLCELTAFRHLCCIPL